MKRDGKHSLGIVILFSLLASACGKEEEPSIKIAGISICVDEGTLEEGFLIRTTGTAGDSIPADPSFKVTEVLDDFFMNQIWDPNGSYLWEFERVKTREAWEWSQGQGIRIAVIDNGIDPYHKIFEGRIDLEGSDFPFTFSGEDADHGTHVAGTILGVAPHATFSFYHTTSNGCSDPGPKGAGMLTALARGHRVLNNSWKDSERYGPNLEICNMVDVATSLGAVVIASAGNNGTNRLTQAPANCEKALAVAATDYGDSSPSFSNTGEIGAPGVDIWSAFPGNSYGDLDGTSQAAPLVSGIVALLLSKNPDLTSEEVRQILRLSADKVSDKDFDAESGYGRVNALKALEWGSTPVCETNILSPTVNHYDENLEVTWHGGREYRNAWSIVEGTVTIQGIANCPHSEFDHYELSYAAGDEPAEEDWQVITEGYEETLEGDLGTFNTDLLSQGDGIYTLRLRVFDSEGNSFEDRNAIQIARALITNYPKNTSVKVEKPITLKGIAKGDHSLQYSLDSMNWQPLTEVKSGPASGVLFENLDLCAPLGISKGGVNLKLVVEHPTFGQVENSIRIDLRCS